VSDEAESKKRPASQYYWGDWWKDKGLHSCSLTARGLWHEMNCLMHEGEPYGHLTLNGRPMTPAQLANQCRISKPQCVKLLAELESAGVFSANPDGVIFSRRMVRDEAIRNARAAGGKAGAEHGFKGAEHGKKGGRPAGDDGGSETPLPENPEGPLKPPPSSSSSSSSSLSQSDPTSVGLVGQAFKRAGVNPMTLNLSDPTLKALIDQGATPDEFEGIAREAIAKGIAKPQPWVCTVLQQRRAQAASVKLAAPTAEAKPWDTAV